MQELYLKFLAVWLMRSNHLHLLRRELDNFMVFAWLRRILVVDTSLAVQRLTLTLP